MPDFRFFDDFLKSIEPRIQPPAGAREIAGNLLEETVEELKVAVEKLRVTHEELLADAARNLETRDRAPTSDRGFRDAFTASPIPMLLTDSAAVVRYANAAASAVLGVRCDQSAGKPLAVYVAPASRRAFRSLLNRLSGNAVASTLEVTLQPRGRCPLPVEATVWPVPGEGGMTLAWSLADAAAERAEPEPDEARATLRAAFDSLPVGVAAMDRDGTVLAWNRTAHALLGWTEEELVGLPNPALGDDSTLDSVRSRGEPADTSALAETRDGRTVPVDVTVAPLMNAGGDALGTVAMIRASQNPAAGAHAWPEGEMRRVLLEGATPGNVTDRLRAGISAGLHAGYLRGGDRLPSIRDAAMETGIDHRVLALAYRRLAAMGLVEVRARKGVRVAPQRMTPEPSLNETAEWLADLLEHAAVLQVRVPGLPELVRRWTAGVELRCACVDDTADGRAALAHAFSHQWGIAAFPVVPRNDAEGRRELGDALRGADLVATSHFHAPEMSALCEAARRPLLLAALAPDAVEAIEERLARGPLNAVVVDPAYGERLRALRGGERLNVVLAGDAAAIDALDPDAPVLATLAAQQQVTRKLRLLVPATNLVAPTAPRALARLLVRANVAPRRPTES